MGDAGIKVARPGIEVSTAPDYQLLFSSSWPTLKLYKSVHIKKNIPPIPAAISVRHLLYEHNLGYVPAFIPYTGLLGSVAADNIAEIGRLNITADEKGIYILAGNSIPFDLDVRVHIFALDIETPYVAPIVNLGTSTQQAVSSDFGIKVAKAGRNAQSKDMRDFVIHSSTRGLLVHAVQPGALKDPVDSGGLVGVFFGFTYTHNLTYSPLFLAYYQTEGGYVLANGFAGVSTNGNAISLSVADKGANVSIIVLKEPFTIDDNIINIAI